MSLSELKVSPYFSIYGITLLFILLSGLAMLILFKLEAYNFKYLYSIGFLEICVFLIVSFYINNRYFSKINLRPPELIGINATLFKGLLIGLSIALVINFPYRIYATIRTGYFEYILLAFNWKIFIQALGAGVFEEITFRGTLLNFYAQKNKKYLGLIISTLLFSLIHILNSFVGTDITFFYMLQIGLFGLLFGLIYLNFGIIASITAHWLGNLLIGGFIQGTMYGVYYNVGIALLLCIWLYLRDKKRIKGTKANNV